jgi:hypothetical protein
MKPDIIESYLPEGNGEGPLFRRLAWFVVLWLLSVTFLTVIAMAIKWAIA